MKVIVWNYIAKALGLSRIESENEPVTDRITDGLTDRRTNKRTDGQPKLISHAFR